MIVKCVYGLIFQYTICQFERKKMNRKKDKSLIKLYKDLMITRRDLIDLRESISHTINSIKISDERIKLIQEERKLRQNVMQRLIAQKPQAPPSYQLKIRAKCQYCSLFFPNNEVLQQHKKEKHEICVDCKQEINESLQDHLLFTCGQSKVDCQGCNQLIKKRDLDAHVKICCFRECYKCKKDIYAKAYLFHLQECKKSKSFIPPCKQLHKPKLTNRSLILPCCLVVDP